MNRINRMMVSILTVIILGLLLCCFPVSADMNVQLDGVWISEDGIVTYYVFPDSSWVTQQQQPGGVAILHGKYVSNGEDGLIVYYTDSGSTPCLSLRLDSMKNLIITDEEGYDYTRVRDISPSDYSMMDQSLNPTWNISYSDIQGIWISEDDQTIYYFSEDGEWARISLWGGWSASLNSYFGRFTLKSDYLTSYIVTDDGTVLHIQENPFTFNGINLRTEYNLFYKEGDITAAQLVQMREGTLDGFLEFGSNLRKRNITQASTAYKSKYLLCAGIDKEGDIYELVADAQESALGFSVKIGVLKNGAWITPLSDDSPFLQEDNMLHYIGYLGNEAATALTSDAEYSELIKKIWFIENGTFVMQSYKDQVNEWGVHSSVNSLIFYNCNTGKSFSLDGFSYQIQVLSNGNIEFYRNGDRTFIRPTDFGVMESDCGKIIVYTMTKSSDSFSITTNYVYDWYILDVETLTLNKIAANCKAYPRRALSEGMFAASDGCFYDASGVKQVDLTAYNIDWDYMWSQSLERNDLVFQNGMCSFVAKNNAGSRFSVEIDAAGNVLGETKLS